MTLDRDRQLAALARALTGPRHGPREELPSFPSDHYAVGALRAVRHASMPVDGDASEARSARRPSVMGLSFTVEGTSPAVVVRAHAGVYAPSADGSWRRRDAAITPPGPLALRSGVYAIDAGDHTRWWVRSVARGARWEVTVSLENAALPGSARVEAEALHLFQVGFDVEASDAARLVPHDLAAARAHTGADLRALLGDDAPVWAVGHRCAATWGVRDGRRVVATTWAPQGHVPELLIDDGHEEARPTFDVESLARAPDARSLAAQLDALPAAYTRWTRALAARVDALVAAESLSAARACAARDVVHAAAAVTPLLREAAASLVAHDRPRRALQLALEAAATCHRWGAARDRALRWGPPLLALLVLSADELARPSAGSDALGASGLLWALAGDDTANAHAALVAFALLLRRLRGAPGDEGAALARYVALHVPRWERGRFLHAALACEHLRRAHPTLGAAPFPVGVVAEVPALFGPYWPGVRDAAPEHRATLVEVVGARLGTPGDVLLHAMAAWPAQRRGCAATA